MCSFERIFHKTCEISLKGGGEKKKLHWREKGGGEVLETTFLFDQLVLQFVYGIRCPFPLTTAGLNGKVFCATLASNW